MSFLDLQSFLHHLESRGDLKRVRVEVDPEYEITEIVCRVVREEGPALLFENVKGSAFPLAVNVLGARRRIEWALGRPPGQVGRELVKVAENVNPPTLSGLWRVRGPLKRLLAMRKRRVGHGPSQEVEAAPDLARLPILKCWPEDGGRFNTFGLVLTRDPETGIGNVGIYRMHVLGPDRTGMHWQIMKGGGYHYHRAETRGEGLEVAVVVGADPALLLSAIAPLPEGFDELAFAGLLRGRATEVVRGKTVSLDVPARSEFVLEGVVNPFEREPEGPFGDHFGHYSHRSPFPVFRLKQISHRRNPVFMASIVGKPPQEDRFMGEAVQEMTGPLLSLMHPEVKDVWAYYEAGFHNLLVVSVGQRFEKEAMKTALGLMGLGQLALTKVLVLVTAGTNVKHFDAVLEAIRLNFDPAEDFLLLPGVPLDTLDFTSFKLNLGSKMILDATAKGKRPDPAPPAAMDLGRFDSRITASTVLGGTLGVVQVRGEGRPVVESLVKERELQSLKILAAVSEDVDLGNREQLLWGLFTRFDAARDVTFTESSLRAAWPVHRGVLGIDATFKEGYPNPIIMDPAVVARVSARWREYGFD